MKKENKFVIIVYCIIIYVKNTAVIDFFKSERLMADTVKEIKIANNIKTVELLKVELLKSVCGMFEDINAEADSETEKRLADDAADIINLTYVLARRLGVSYVTVMRYIKAKLERSIEQQHPIEKNYRDMASFLLEKEIAEGMKYAYISCTSYTDYLKKAFETIKYSTNYSRVYTALDHISKALSYEESNMPYTAQEEIKKVFPGV